VARTPAERVLSGDLAQVDFYIEDRVTRPTGSAAIDKLHKQRLHVDALRTNRIRGDRVLLDSSTALAAPHSQHAAAASASSPSLWAVAMHVAAWH